MRALLSALLIVSLGCGSSSPPATTSGGARPAAAAAPAPHGDGLEHALAHAPAGTVLLLGLDVPALVAGPHGDALRRQVVALDLPAPCTALSAAAFGHVTMAIRGQDDLSGTISGHLPEERMVPCLTAVVAGKGGRLVASTLQGHTTYHAEDSPEDNAWVTWRAPGQPVIASSADALLAALDVRGPRIDRTLADAARAADRGRTAWLAAIVTPEQIAATEMPLPKLTHPLAVRAAADIGDEVDVEAVLGFGPAADPARVADALAFADALRTLLASLRGTHADDVATSTTVETAGAQVRLLIHLDADALARLGKQIEFK